MLILGIESSCDDTGASLIKDDMTVLSNVVASQDFIHGEYGGVVPELASRRHIEAIIPVIEEALKKAKATIDDVDLIGVTQGPGLVGSILIGLTFAKSISYAKKKPFVGVNHIFSHALGVFLSASGGEKGREGEAPEFPFVSLVVSGGHTALILADDFTTFKMLGQTRDDSAGEAFDKVAKLLGLGYPGGVAIDRLAKNGNPHYLEFTRPYIEKGNLEFSFSGLKTAALNVVKGFKGDEIPPDVKNDIAASFQEAIVDVLVEKARWAMESTGIKRLVCAGGVASNARLRKRLGDMGEKLGARVFIPPPKFCSDNGAMVAVSAYHLFKKGERGGLNMNAEPSFSW